jgi:AcrR family transcriptional regulator
MDLLTTETDRRERVITAAWEVFARFGYQKASMQDIAAVAQVSKSVLFKYFQTKENLYRTAFRLASESIFEADRQAANDSSLYEDVFSLMRRKVDVRMQLFARSPYVYQFSYTAAYDADPLARQLVLEEFARRGVSGESAEPYRGIRRDISPQRAKQMIFWISQGFLGEQLATGMAEPEILKQEYLEWIDMMELLLKEQDVGESK